MQARGNQSAILISGSLPDQVLGDWACEVTALYKYVCINYDTVHFSNECILSIYNTMNAHTLKYPCCVQTSHHHRNPWASQHLHRGFEE